MLLADQQGRCRTICEVPGQPSGLGSDRENRLLAVAAVLAADAPGSGRLAPDGICLDAVYAVALGGDDGRTLFMCAAPPLGQSDPTREHRAALLSRTVEMPGR